MCLVYNLSGKIFRPCLIMCPCIVSHCIPILPKPRTIDQGSWETYPFKKVNPSLPTPGKRKLKFLNLCHLSSLIYETQLTSKSPWSRYHVTGNPNLALREGWGRKKAAWCWELLSQRIANKPLWTCLWLSYQPLHLASAGGNLPQSDSNFAFCVQSLLLFRCA